MGRVTTRHPVLKIGPAEVARRSDRLAVEEPLEIRLNGTPFTVTMRTPGSDIELVHGLLHSEQVIDAASDIILARYCDGSGPDGLNTYNVVDVTLAPALSGPEPGLQRNVLTTSACGICGSTSIENVQRQARFVLNPDLRVTPSAISAGQERLRTSQRIFDQTGGLHAAGLVSSQGECWCVREDVGRHNAVDKVVGWALQSNRLPLSDAVLCVSGRASFELTQKAVLAGIPVLAAVSAPSSLAVELAESTGLTLIGFVRGERMNVYTHAYRVADVATEASAVSA
jgi:FdhD protein